MLRELADAHMMAVGVRESNVLFAEIVALKKAKAVGIQYAALPYRLIGRRVEILLITTRETRRWVTPKGWPIAGMSPSQAAAVEAAEEAGVFGAVETHPVGTYRYMKTLKRGRRIPVQVIVFPFLVEGQDQVFKEQGQRDLVWAPYGKAASMVAEGSFRRLIRDFGRARTPGLMRLFRPFRLARAALARG